MLQERIFPLEVTTGAPRVILTGDVQLEVEQHRGLIRCETEQISLQTECGVLVISGSGLALRRYTAAEAVISGRIGSVELQCEGRQHP